MARQDSPRVTECARPAAAHRATGDRRLAEVGPARGGVKGEQAERPREVRHACPASRVIRLAHPAGRSWRAAARVLRRRGRAVEASGGVLPGHAVATAEHHLSRGSG